MGPYACSYGPYVVMVPTRLCSMHRYAPFMGWPVGSSGLYVGEPMRRYDQYTVMPVRSYGPYKVMAHIVMARTWLWPVLGYGPRVVMACTRLWPVRSVGPYGLLAHV